MIRLAAAILIFGCSCAPGLAGTPWSSVEKILGRAGQEQGNLFRVDFPREDLNVTVQGVPLEPEGALTSRFFFKPLAKGTLLMGDLVLLEREVSLVTAQLKKNGFQTTDAHDFLPGDSPHVKMIHIRGKGYRANLAQALQRVLSSKPLREDHQPEAKTGPIVPTAEIGSAKSPWEEWESLLGPGIAHGKILLYEYPSRQGVLDQGEEIPPFMGMETTLWFQKVHGTAVGRKNIWGFEKKGALSKDMVAGGGQFLLPADQVDRVKESLARHHVTAVSTRELNSSPPVFLLYFWVLGPSVETAAGFKDLLNEMDPGESK